MNIEFLGQTFDVAMIYYAIVTLIHLAFSAGVAKDAGEIVRQRGSTLIVGPYVWAFATLIGGVMVAGIYWAMHYIPYFLGGAKSWHHRIENKQTYEP